MTRIASVVAVALAVLAAARPAGAGRGDGPAGLEFAGYCPALWQRRIGCGTRSDQRCRTSGPDSGRLGGIRGRRGARPIWVMPPDAAQQLARDAARGFRAVVKNFDHLRDHEQRRGRPAASAASALFPPV